MALLKRIVAALTAVATNLEAFGASVAEANTKWRQQLALDGPDEDTPELEDKRRKKAS